jgi:VCBS repeat-containing protein
METCAKRLRAPVISLLLAACVLLPSHATLRAGYPHGAYYSADTDNVFWFIHASDTHVGTEGTTDSDGLAWLVNDARTYIKPQFMVVTGDLTDSTDGNWLGWPNGPYQSEWNQYQAVISAARGVSDWKDFFYDLPGNHDAYNDADFSYYLANSVQGRAGRGPQLSWTHVLGGVKYHFLGVNSADNTGAGFSFLPPYGDHAGLDTSELTFISQQLSANSDAALTFVFGHHPVTATGSSSDTYLYYGQNEFVTELDTHAVSAYNYGHTHGNSEALFTGNGQIPMPNGGVHYYNVASLGKDSPNSFSVVAVDCNGVSSVTKTIGSWPVVLITAPVDKYVGTAINPYAYPVTKSTANPIRALVFNPTAVTAVSYQVGSGAWLPMSQVPSKPDLWQASWDASELQPGEHTIRVQAGSTVDSIKVQLTGPVNLPPTAAGNTYTTPYQTVLSVPAPGVLGNDSDPEGAALTAALVSGPSYGTLTLNDNGSFTYTPNNGYSGPDSFSYKAFDGALYSAAATVSITVNGAPTTDTVAIVTALWTKRTATLKVEATSSAAPSAGLTASGIGFSGAMIYNSKTKRYTYQKVVSPAPPSVTVTSTKGGSATKAVTTK